MVDCYFYVIRHILCCCREQLIQLQSRHDQLLSDYHDLLVESDRKADKVGSLFSLFCVSCVMMLMSYS